MFKRSARAVWKGGLKDGRGSITTSSGVLRESQYSFTTRFEQGVGTNPEELVAAALAGCFSMALSVQLEQAGLTPTSIETNATAAFEKTDAGWRVTSIHLDVTADVLNATAEAFDGAAQAAKTGCPISNLLNTRITMDARLASVAQS
jgi:osmotically inducible protein OsmC